MKQLAVALIAAVALAVAAGSGQRRTARVVHAWASRSGPALGDE